MAVYYSQGVIYTNSVWIEFVFLFGRKVVLHLECTPFLNDSTDIDRHGYSLICGTTISTGLYIHGRVDRLSKSP